MDPIPCKHGLCSSKTAHCLAKSWLKQMNQTEHPFTQLNMQQMVLQIQDVVLSWNFKLRRGGGGGGRGAGSKVYENETCYIFEPP